MSGQPGGCLEKCQRLMRWNLKAAATLLADDHIIHANEVVSQFGEELAIACAGAARRPRLPYAPDPAYVVRSAKLAARAGERRRLGLLRFVKELAFVQRHVRMIAASSSG